MLISAPAAWFPRVVSKKQTVTRWKLSCGFLLYLCHPIIWDCNKYTIRRGIFWTGSCKTEQNKALCCEPSWNVLWKGRANKAVIWTYTPEEGLKTIRFPPHPCIRRPTVKLNFPDEARFEEHKAHEVSCRGCIWKLCPQFVVAPQRKHGLTRISCMLTAPVDSSFVSPFQDDPA